MNTQSKCCSSKPCCSQKSHSSKSDIQQTDSVLRFSDRVTHLKARLGINRMSYSVNPGLYRLGNPDKHSPVFVTANYTLSFDALRQSLKDIDSWILVLNTNGVNVWCAAGKGLFSTEELIHRIQSSEIKSLISHNVIILPQLGAPGISAHKVSAATGFKIKFGPVRASDLPDYLKKNMTADDTMRRVNFGLFDRVILAPVELKQVLKYIPLIFLMIFIMNAFKPDPVFFNTLKNTVPFIIAIFSGTLLFPLLLPYLPGRSFSFKGFILGVIAIGLYNYLSFSSPFGNMFYFFTAVPITAYLALNFTGCSTYTSLSGVVREMKLYIPIMIISIITGIVIEIISIIRNGI